MGPLRWGFVGAGKISNDFASCLQILPPDEHQMVSVAASDVGKANEFANIFGFKKAYGTYAAIAADPDVDVVYIGTINSNHYELAKLMLENDKHVLCEKPLTLMLEHTQELIALAEKKKKFFQEAVWSRFFPSYHKLRETLKARSIGDVRLVSVQFGFNAPHVDRLARKELGGGSLVDIGVYCIQFILAVYGPEMPDIVKAIGKLNHEGCDMSVNAVLQWKDGRSAQFATTFLTDLPSEAYVYGSDGSIKMPRPFWCTTDCHVTELRDESSGPKSHTAQKTAHEEKHSFPLPVTTHPLVFENGAGMVYEAQEVRRCIQNGLLESPHMTHQETLLIATIQDQIKRQIGLSYDELYVDGGLKITKAVP
ncbi:trans-1,2-dihydrobenzene-1,2-diol dehydrogenase-like [Paramacrobiotus metropolitanus]|uniref:trans-1,2-dihydrobenzene-1,2-diol dehydrogenase-like n=1 Tax=Paramacrobiotus metropolitanus TaxID=2943436 RepID=UPI0024458FE3|nr:trans-1,2-dihydrobenzene-1,2-diol dehydrogenase-like [Paramacrobiotus metropolitanus]